MKEIPAVDMENIDQVKQIADRRRLVLAFFQNPTDGSGPDFFVGIEPNCIQPFAEAIKTFASHVGEVPHME